MENHVRSIEDKPTNRLLIGIPMTGLLRCEWHLSMMGLVVPTNWSHGMYAYPIPSYSPIGFNVANGRNIIVQKAVLEAYEWLLFIDHDVILPIDFYILINQYMRTEEVPVVGGLYFTKSKPAEPLIYRGRGNSFFTDWKMGDKVWCDGMGLGCHLISTKLLRLMWEDAEWYLCPDTHTGQQVRVKKVFETPAFVATDPLGRVVGARKGTEDLPWYSKAMDEGYLAKAGWTDFPDPENPYLCDTNLMCRHIDQNGKQYPAHDEEKEYMPEHNPELQG